MIPEPDTGEPKTGVPPSREAALPAPAPASRAPGGFTLLEVIVALAIAAAALAVLATTLGGALDGAARLTRRAEALERARSHLAMAMAMPRLPPGPHGGDDGDGYRWRLDVRQIAVLPARNARPLGFYAVTVEIDWGLAGRVRLAGRRFAPPAPS